MSYSKGTARYTSPSPAQTSQPSARLTLLHCRDKSIEYRDIGTKDIFQIQCPIKLKVPKNWTKVSGTQQVTRYYSPEVLTLVKQLKEVRERRDQASKVFQFTVGVVSLRASAPY